MSTVSHHPKGRTPPNNTVVGSDTLGSDSPDLVNQLAVNLKALESGAGDAEREDEGNGPEEGVVEIAVVDNDVVPVITIQVRTRSGELYLRALHPDLYA